MTKEEKIIATAFTGKMFIDGSDIGLLYEYMEKKVGLGVIDLMLADKKFWEELHKACEQDFIDMVSKEQPSLPDNLDEAARYYEEHRGPSLDSDNEECRKAFKAGAEWMKRKMMEGAVEGEVCILPGYVAYVKEKNNESLKQYLLDNFKTGDEVSIIILPKED